MQKLFNRTKLIWITICLTAYFSIPGIAAAADPDITAGLTNTTATTLADKIIKIATGVGELAGAIAVVMIIFCGIKMATATNERSRADAKDQLVQVLVALGVVGLAVSMVGFIAYLIRS